MWENNVLMGVANNETWTTPSYLSCFKGPHMFSFLSSFIFFFILLLYFNSVIFLLVSQISQPVHHCYPLWPSTTVNTKTCILQPIIPFGYIWAAWPSKWRHGDLSKCQELLSRWHITSQKTWIFHMSCSWLVYFKLQCHWILCVLCGW